MGNAAELRVARHNTLAFIAADAVDVLLNRPVYGDDGAGGRVKEADSPLPSQRFRIVPMSGLVWDRTDPTPDEGRLMDVTMQLVGRHDADVKQDDWFKYDRPGMPGRMIVTHVSPFRHYRTVATVIFHADVDDGSPMD